MRGKKALKKDIKNDRIYNRVDISKFINYIMEDGKRQLSENIVYGAFDIIKSKTKKNPVDIFDSAIKNISPQIEVRSKRIGGGNDQVPMEVASGRRQALAFRWILKAANSKSGSNMQTRLANELMMAAEGQGDAIKKKEDVYKQAQANRAFAHFARF